jgi:hypothetical protein
MDVPRVPAIPPVAPVETGMPASGEPASGGGDLPFTMGQKLFARVIQLAGDGRAVLDVGGERFLAATPLAVHEGDVLPVVVRGLGPVVELDVEAPPVAFSEAAYAVAAIRQARQQAGAASPLTAAEIDTLALTLERANWGGGPPGLAPRERLLALLRPLPLGREAAPLVDALRERLAANGTFFEAHAARALTGAARGAPAADLQADVRWLLAALEREARVQPDLEPLRQRLIHEIATRQLDTAFARVHDGEVRLDIPVAFGHADAPAHLAVRDDGPAPRAGGRPRGRAITLTIGHPDLGPVEAAAHWQPGGGTGDLQIRFTVRDANAAAVLAPASSDLTSRLRAAGFRHVAVAVAVDPALTLPAAGAPPPDEEPPPGGSILSALA